MKFGKYMKQSMVPEWAVYYVDYKALKNIIKNVALQKLRAEAKFVATLESEMKKANTFYQRLVAELRERLNRDPSPNNCKEVSVQLIKISQFGHINENAVRKALKKHDRSVPSKVGPTYLVKLNTESFCPREKFDAVMMMLSDIYDKATDRVSKVQDKKKYSDTLFMRKSLKYWIRLKDVTEVICKIIPHLPIYHFKKEKEQHSIAAPITSIYFDSPEFYSYRTRLEKHEGATLVRVRWYGANEPASEVFVERKLHHESWVMEGSTKSRFTMPSNGVLSYFKDVGPVPLNKKEKVKKEAQPLLVLEEEKSPEQILAEEIREHVAKHRLQPQLRTQYLRAAFQLPDDNSVRISLDTDLTMIRERVDWRREWFVPEEQLLESDVHNFPYAVLEVKLQGTEEERPAWVSELMKSDLLLPREKFSKFCHGLAVLYTERVSLLPYWLEGKAIDEFRADIVAPATPHSHKPELPRPNGNVVRERIAPLEVVPRTQAITIDVNDDGPMAAFARCVPFIGDCVPGGAAKRATTRDRLKIEPKTYFANERTYLQWFNASALLGTLGLALINTASGSGGRATGIIMIPTAVALMLYALWQYHRRLNNIRERKPDGYHDPYGPTILSVIIAIAMVMSGFFALVFKSSPTA